MACCKRLQEECYIRICNPVENGNCWERIKDLGFALLTSDRFPRPLGMLLWSVLHLLLIFVVSPLIWVRDAVCLALVLVYDVVFLSLGFVYIVVQSFLGLFFLCELPMVEIIPWGSTRYRIQVLKLQYWRPWGQAIVAWCGEVVHAYDTMAI